MEASDYELICKKFESFIAKFKSSLRSASEILEDTSDEIEWEKCATNLIESYFKKYSNKFTTFPIYNTPVQPSLQLILDTFDNFFKLFECIDATKANELKTLFVDKLSNKVLVIS
jgi:hypothetical protein